MPLQATSGAASYDAFGGGVPVTPVYIEDVMSVWLYTGNGSTQTITNGIDLAGEGGLVWIKNRGAAGNSHSLMDTVRGGGSIIYTDLTVGAESYNACSFLSSGFSVNINYANLNANANTYVSWTFRKQPKFFDVVTYTGTGSTQTINHNLGSTPGCIIVKATSIDQGWPVYHRSLGGADKWLVLNSTTATITSANYFGTPTSTNFTVVSDNGTNGAGVTYVAYLFAHDAGGFGLTGTDNVISCGSYTGNGSLTAGPQIDLGYEPQWLMVKRANSNGAWLMMDAMRGFPVSGAFSSLQAQTSGAEGVFSNGPSPTATGFVVNSNQSDMNQSGSTYIYIAIRRGPMKVPTTGTSVFSPITSSASTGTVLTTSFPVDLQIASYRSATDNKYFMDRLRGVSTPGAAISTPILYSTTTDAEVTNGSATRSFDNTSFQMSGLFNGLSSVFWSFGRAPGFFDVVCYTGTGVARTVAHNLTVAPELMIFKNRTDSDTGWITALTVGGLSWTSGNFLRLELTNGTLTNTAVLDTTPTATVFSIPSTNTLDHTASNYVAYLFATCPGVSKVGSYTGNGTTQAVACGFTGGARFVLIKRTDASGDWYVYDTARGMTVLTDPYLLLNSTAAETATLGSVITSTGGFTVNAAILAAINTNAASYIFLAIS